LESHTAVGQVLPQAAETVTAAPAVDQRVVVDRCQHAQREIDAAAADGVIGWAPASS
jgi:hypothetical protein